MRRRGFTLVELLVVIGIVALLVAILMPALGRAREAANRVRCMATLRSMAQAAHLHASEHLGYMPIAGGQDPAYLGVSASPQGLRDTEQRKYIYYKDGSRSELRPVPLTAALGYYMGLRNEIDPLPANSLDCRNQLDAEAIRRHFTCASQDPETMRWGFVLADSGTRVFPQVRMSYIFNGAVLARQIHPWGETPAGKLSAIRRPSIVFLFADGNPAPEIDFRGYAIEAGRAPDESIYWYYLFMRIMFDHNRHRGKMNVVFVDGHGETIQMPDPTHSSDDPKDHGDFLRVGVTLGIYD